MAFSKTEAIKLGWTQRTLRPSPFSPFFLVLNKVADLQKSRRLKNTNQKVEICLNF